MKRKFVGLEVEEISVVSAGANPHAHIVLLKSTKKLEKKDDQQCRLCSTVVNAGDKYCKGCGAPFYKTEEIMDEKLKAELEKQAAEVAKANAELTERVKKSEEALAAANARTAELEKKNAETARIAKVRDKKDSIKSTMKGLPAPADLAEKLVEIEEKVGEELSKYLEEVLAKAAALVEEGMLLKQTSAGVTKNASAVSSVQKKVDELVAELQKADPKLSTAKAEAQVYTAHPALYKEYIAEQEQAQ